MKHITDLEETYEICSALGSPVRLEIVRILLKEDYINLDGLAKRLHLTNGAITPHIKKLESAGIIRITAASGVRGAQKQCSLSDTRILIDMSPSVKTGGGFSLSPGHYYEYKAEAPCGMAGAEGIISENDPPHFSLPDRYNAGVIWLTGGFLSYALPLPSAAKPLKSLTVTAEIAAENGAEISLCGVILGAFTTQPGKGGSLNPPFFKNKTPKSGRLKELSVTAAGSYLDGAYLSPFSITRFAATAAQKPPVLKIEVQRTATLALFGTTFGTFPQNITIKYEYDL